MSERTQDPVEAEYERFKPYLSRRYMPPVDEALEAEYEPFKAHLSRIPSGLRANRKDA